MVIVTGGAGFIGSAFIWKLNQEGISNIILVDTIKDSEKWKNLVSLKYSDYINKEDFLDLLIIFKSNFKKFLIFLFSFIQIIRYFLSHK